MTLPANTTTQTDTTHAQLIQALEQSIANQPNTAVQIQNGQPHYSQTIQQGRKPNKNQIEEIIRALYIIHLIHTLNYPPQMIEIEHRIRARVGRGQKDKYTDIAIHQKQNHNQTIYLIAEIKAPGAYHNERDAAWENQLFNLAQFINPKPACLVYGTHNTKNIELELVDFKKYDNHNTWLNHKKPIKANTIPPNYDIPRKQPLIKDSPTNDIRSNIQQDEINRLQRDLHNVLWGGGQSTDSEIFNFITRLIMAKAYDENTTNPGTEYKFQIKEGENLDNTIQRITKLYQNSLIQILEYHPETAQHQPLTIKNTKNKNQTRFAIEQLEKYHLSKIANSDNTNDILGRFFEHIIRTGFKQSKGQFFTHTNITNFMAHSLELGKWATQRAAQGKPPPKIIDPSAGSGTFLISAMKHIHQNMQKFKQTPNTQHNQFTQQIIAQVTEQPRRNEWAKKSCYGIEISDDLALAAQVNMFVHGDGSSSIFTGQTDGDALNNLNQYKNKNLFTTKSHKSYNMPVSETFDAILTNPPFSAKYPNQQISDYRKWINLAQHSSKSEDYFLERWFQLLTPKGRLAAIIPNSQLDAIGTSHGRNFLIQHFNIKAIISLPADTFYPHTMTKTSILIAEKKTEDKITQAYNQTLTQTLHDNPPILFAQTTYLGYQRTAKGETPHPRNDLDTVLKNLQQAKIWQPTSQNQPNLIPTTKLTDTPNIRLDADHAIHQSALKNPQPITQIYTLSTGNILEKEPNNPYYYCEIGDISRNGTIAPRHIDPKKTDIDPDTKKQIDRLRAKIQKGNAMSLNDWAVLVPKTRPYLKKFALINGKENTYFTTDLFPLKPGHLLLTQCNQNPHIATCLLYLLLKGEIGDLFTAISRWGKSYPTLHPIDLQKAVISTTITQTITQPNLHTKAKKLHDIINTIQQSQHDLQQITKNP